MTGTPLLRRLTVALASAAFLVASVSLSPSVSAATTNGATCIVSFSLSMTNFAGLSAPYPNGDSTILGSVSDCAGTVNGELLGGTGGVGGGVECGQVVPGVCVGTASYSFSLPTAGGSFVTVNCSGSWVGVATSVLSTCASTSEPVVLDGIVVPSPLIQNPYQTWRLNGTLTIG